MFYICFRIVSSYHSKCVLFINFQIFQSLWFPSGLPATTLTVLTMTWLTFTEHLCQKWPWICSVCLSHNLVLSSFMICHRVCNKSNTTDATYGVEMLTLPKHPSSLPVFTGVNVARSVVLCVIFCRLLCPFVLFLLAIVLSSVNFV